ncbi:MAG: glycoside hydrolase family 18 protein [Coxiellaceae bacterium]|nr:glycoside hydrolase family 18 protein [Coxiellaceae bacterium]
MKTIRFFFILIAFLPLPVLAKSALCSPAHVNQRLVVAYLGADQAWQLTAAQQQQLKTALQHVTVVNYAFIRVVNNRLNFTATDIANIKIIQQISPKTPIIISIGGWGGRDDFNFMYDSTSRSTFINSVKFALKKYKIAGVDVDWENEQLAPTFAANDLVSLLSELRQQLPKNTCITNAVPGSPIYWSQYPAASLWQANVNWTTLMSYDDYGTFGPSAELAAPLYKDPSYVQQMGYPYPVTSGNRAVQYYQQQGLPSRKIVLGIPFYCHSYYLTRGLGLHDVVLDANINSQVDYSVAYKKYKRRLFQYHVGKTSYGLIDLPDTNVVRFLSCDSPESIYQKMDYVSKKKLGGVSFWSLLQDLPYHAPDSLLKAINKGEK